MSSKPVGSYGDTHPIPSGMAASTRTQSRPPSALESTILTTFDQPLDAPPLQFAFKCNTKPIPLALDSSPLDRQPRLPSPSMKTFMDNFYYHVFIAAQTEPSPIATLISNDEFKAQCTQLIQHVQRTFFPTPPGTTLEMFALSLEQKQQFIQLFYTLLAQELAYEVKAQKPRTP